MNDFLDLGYAIVDLPIRAEMESVHAEFVEIFSRAATQAGGPRVESAADVVALYRRDPVLWASAWNVLASLPTIHRLASDSTVLQLASACGIKVPCHGSAPQVRADMPNDDYYGRFDTHQDFPYNAGSENSVTIWVPFQDVSHQEGCLRVAPGSHRFGVIGHDNGIIRGFPEEQLMDVPVKCGQALVFSQFLVHKSGKNVNDHAVRFSLQLRVNDLAAPDFCARRWYTNHVTQPRMHLASGQVAPTFRVVRRGGQVA